mmetsp:Transcript_67358/g.217496  ORF Transcript_67358/g.217496 Transcript_67358/m.217496 type:complete len:376 (-) Transcript_67358:161-1288(-)
MRDSGAGTMRRPSYSPPTGAHTRPHVGAVGAAAALALLECDPSSVLVRPLGGRKGRSAAALARELYTEALETQPPADLLEFDSPAATSSAAVADPAVTMPPVVAAVASAASPASQGAREPMVQLDTASGLWPGDVVLARYGPRGVFYRARIVRVYSRNGASLADVEWLRPPADCREDGEYLTGVGADLDDTRHRHALQVDRDLRSAHGGSHAHGAGSPETQLPRATAAPTPFLPPPPGPSRPAGSAAPASALPDLLDLQGTPAEATDLLGGNSPAPAAAAAPQAVPAAPGVGAPGVWTTPGSWAPLQPGPGGCDGAGGPSAAAWAAPNAVARSPMPATGLQPLGTVPPQALQPERFGFVSDMISRATDAPGSAGT